MEDRRKDFFDFLCDAFTSAEIRQLARFGPGTPAIVNALSQNAPHRDVVMQYVEAIESQSLINAMYWQFLRTLRPTRLGDISSLETRWTGATSALSGAPTRGQTKSLRTIDIASYGKFRVAQQVIAKGKGEPILLVGDYRSGKTTWLRQLQKSMSELSAITVFPSGARRATTLISQFIDNQLDIRVLTAENFWRTAFESVHRWASKNERRELANETAKVGQLSSDSQISRLTSLMGAENIRLVLIIDNFDRIWESQRFSDSDLLFRLRYLAETSQRTFSLVASSRLDITTMNRRSRTRFRREGSPLFNYFQEYFLGPLSRSNFLSLFGGDCLERQDYSFIYAVTGGSYRLSRQLHDELLVARNDESDLIKSRCIAARNILEANYSTFLSIWEDWAVPTRHAVFLMLVKQLETTLTNSTIFRHTRSITPLEELFEHEPELRTLRKRGLIEFVDDERSQQLVSPKLFFWWFIERLLADGFARAQDCVSWFQLKRISTQAIEQLDTLLTKHRQSLLKGVKTFLTQAAENP